MDMAIMGDVYIGTPPQHMTVILDSGSPDLWLPAADCAMCHKRYVEGNKYFEWKQSSSLRVMKSTLAVGVLSWATHPSKCFDVAEGGVKNGNTMQLWTCLNGTNQLFLPPGPGMTGPIRWAAHPEKCIDVASGHAENGNKIQLWDCIDRGHSPNQIFHVPKGGAGHVRWALHPGKCLDVAGGEAADGARLQLWDCTDAAPNQQFLARQVRSTEEAAVRDIYFGTGRVEGTAATDTLRFAGIELERQRLLVVEKEMFAPPDHVWDGILGLAKTEYSVIGAPFFTRLRDIGVAPLFVFIPTRSQSGRHAELRIGESALHSPEVSQQTLTWVPSSERGLWYINGSVGVSQQRSMRRFLVDTGTTVIVMIPEDFQTYVNAIRPQRGCFRRGTLVTCACSDVPNMPPLMFQFGNVTMALGALDLFQPSGKAMGGPFGAEPGCELQVSVGVPSEGWVLGDNFLRKVVVVFDYEQRRIGFAAPTEQSSVEMRVTGGPGGMSVQTRLSKHSTVMTRRSTDLFVQLSADSPWGLAQVAGARRRVPLSLQLVAICAAAPAMLLVMGAVFAFVAARRRSWRRRAAAAAAARGHGGSEDEPLRGSVAEEEC